MRLRLVLGSAVVAIALVLLVAWWFEMSLERAALLAPVIVVSFGAAAGVAVLWTRVALETVRRRRPRRGRTG